MAKRHYHVYECMEGGYSSEPDSIVYYTNRREAERDVAERARRARDEGDTTSGSARDGMIVCHRGTSLDWLIVLNTCQDDCDPDECGAEY